MSVRNVQRIQDEVAEYWPEVRWVESTGSTNSDLLNDNAAPVSYTHLTLPTNREV